MSEILSKDDVSLLKSYFTAKNHIFGRLLHKSIYEHKNTPRSVLKVLIKEPQKQIGFLKTILITIVAFAFGYSANFDSQTIDPLFRFILSMSIIIMLLTASASLFLTTYFIGIVDKKWTLLKFIIVLKSTNEEEKTDLRSYLEEQAK